MAAALLTFGGGVAAAQSFNGQQEAEIRAIVRDYLVNNPDVLREALDALDARAQADLWRRVKSDARDFSLGPADAPIVMVEYFDYRCPYCHAALEWVMDTVAARRDVRVVFRELPILGPDSLEASRAALAAKPQGRYWAFHRALMGFRGELNSARIDAIAQSVGIDVTRMRRAMQDREIGKHIDDVNTTAAQYALNGTPGFVINGELVRGGFNRELLEARLREASRQVRTSR